MSSQTWPNVSNIHFLRRSCFHPLHRLPFLFYISTPKKKNAHKFWHILNPLPSHSMFFSYAHPSQSLFNHHCTRATTTTIASSSSHFPKRSKQKRVSFYKATKRRGSQWEIQDTRRHCEFDMEAIKLKPQILTKEFSSVPQSLAGSLREHLKLKRINNTQRERNYQNKWWQVREKEKDMSKLCSFFIHIWLLFNFYYLKVILFNKRLFQILCRFEVLEGSSLAIDAEATSLRWRLRCGS